MGRDGDREGEMEKRPLDAEGDREIDVVRGRFLEKYRKGLGAGQCRRGGSHRREILTWKQCNRDLQNECRRVREEEGGGSLGREPRRLEQRDKERA
eukprot:11889998-Karenia_brevis.AAC.1